MVKNCPCVKRHGRCAPRKKVKHAKGKHRKARKVCEEGKMWCKGLRGAERKDCIKEQCR